MSSAIHTRDHETIRKWAEARDGHPSQVKGTGGLLRIDFGEPEQELEPLDWNSFFEKFDESDIDFLYDPKPKSRFNKFVRRSSDQ